MNEVTKAIKVLVLEELGVIADNCITSKEALEEFDVCADCICKYFDAVIKENEQLLARLQRSESERFKEYTHYGKIK